jgi:hypothetical protein
LWVGLLQDTHFSFAAGPFDSAVGDTGGAFIGFHKCFDPIGSFNGVRISVFLVWRQVIGYASVCGDLIGGFVPEDVHDFVDASSTWVGKSGSSE